MYLSIFDDKPNLHEIDFKIDKLINYSDINIDMLNNLIFIGPPGSGKTVKVYAFLCSLFNKKVYELRNMTFEHDNKSVTYKSSIYHIEIDTLELLTNERMFFYVFLKDYCVSRNIGLDLPKVIYIKNAEYLNKLSYLFLRKVIEKNYKTSKFIFEMSTLSGVPPAIQSRFFIIRIKVPSKDEALLCLKDYTKKKNIELDEKILLNIMSLLQKKKGFNLKNIFGFLRYYLVTGKYFKFFYDQYLEQIIDIIFDKNIKISDLNCLKDLIEDMFVNLVSSTNIFNIIFENVLDKIENNDELKFKIVEITVYHEMNMKKGNKEFIHIFNYIVDLIDCIRSNNYV